MCVYVLSCTYSAISKILIFLVVDLNKARALEQEAHPALDKLTSKISTLNLERVRQIKSRLVAITGRVQKVRAYFLHAILSHNIKNLVYTILDLDIFLSTFFCHMV